jgi:hypothetical protein
MIGQDIDPGSAVDVLGQDMVERMLALAKDACRRAARDPEPCLALAALQEIYLIQFAHILAFCYPQEMRAGAVKQACAALKGMVCKELIDTPSIWTKG